MIKQEIEQAVRGALEAIGAGEASFTVEHPTDFKMGDYSTNAGIKTGKAKELLEHLAVQPPSGVERIELAGPGFINFYLSKEFFKESLGEIIEKGENFGKNESLKGEKVMVEHTDPNPFKPLHVGHLVPLSIGSTLARIEEWNGAEAKQACYQGDVGLHVAKAVWGILNGKENPYVAGNKAYEEDENAKQEIIETNKKIYAKSDAKINEVYEKGRKESLDYFDSVYKKLGVKFNYFFFESEVAEAGKKIVSDNPGVFIESQGAIIFPAETHDPSLHTRVFINSEGLPVYEAKELALAKLKADKYSYTKSIVVTGNEIKEYFRVLLLAMKLVLPDLAQKTKHIPHGMLRLPTGKMSSRTGDVITAEALIEEVKTKVKEDEEVAIGAIKYMILRANIGGDIVFDIEKSVSTEGDSGVYLQYAHARACSIVAKADLTPSTHVSTPLLDLGEGQGVRTVERLLYRFPEIVERAGAEYAPNYIVTYLTQLSAAFNNFYAHEPIIGNEYCLAITKAFQTVMKNGLNILGIPAPEKM